MTEPKTMGGAQFSDAYVALVKSGGDPDDAADSLVNCGA